MPGRRWFFLAVRRHFSVLVASGGALGVLAGLVVRRANPSEATIELIGYVGELFVRSLKASLAPMIFCSMINCTNLHVSSSETTFAPKVAVAFYSVTTVLASTVAVVAFEVIRPGTADRAAQPASGEEVGAHSATGTHESHVLRSMLALGRNIVPDNMPRALSDMRLLSVITSAVAVGLALRHTATTHPVAVAPVLALCKAVFEASLALISWLVLLAPFGVCSMVARCVLEMPDVASVALGLAMMVLTTLAAMLFHVFVSLSLLALLSAPRRHPWRYVAGLTRSTAMAFGTASSAATLATTLECVVAQGVRKETAAFVLPLGATVNMDGGAIGLVISVLYLANASGQLAGMHAVDVANIALVCALLSVGAAPVPSSGMVSLILAMEGTGVRITSLTASVLAIDWFTERMRTAVNVMSDAVICLCVDSLATRPAHKPEDAPVCRLVEVEPPSGAICNDGGPQRAGPGACERTGLPIGTAAAAAEPSRIQSCSVSV